MSKALVLFSGGLDSMLAVKILQAQNVEVAGICFTSNFFNADKALSAAKQLKIELSTPDISEEILALVKNPPSGYGKNMNPCVDCHAMMMRLAGQIAQEKGFDFIATGEVLGQRPFSQNKEALLLVQKFAGIEILRPLSAKLLPETEYEKKGLVIRGRLLAVQGRQRETQMELAKKYGITEYPSPAGGCLLTDPDFSRRLLELIENWPDANKDDIEILKYGRVIWLYQDNNKILAIIGRKESDNNKLEQLVKNSDIMLKLEEIPSPTILIRSKEGFNIGESEIKIKKTEIKLSELKLNESKSTDELITTAIDLLLYYTKKAPDQKLIINIYNK